MVVTLTGKTELASDVFAALAGTDKKLTIKGDGYTWSISGKDITNTAAKVDFGVRLQKTVPDTQVPANVKAKEVVLGITLKHSGEFPGKMTLEVFAGKEHGGKKLNLYYLNSGAAEFVESYQADAQGKVVLNFTHASNYILTPKHWWILKTKTAIGRKSILIIWWKKV